MKLAFLISAHTDPTHLKRLVNSLPNGSEFYIHIDRKSDISQFTDILNGQHIHYIGHRVNVMWGSLTEVEYQMELVRAAIEGGGGNYLITLSGLDYPLWSNTAIMDFFENANGKEFIQGFNLSHQTENIKNYTEFRLLNNRPWKYGSVGSKFRVALRHAISMMGIHKTLTIHTKEKDFDFYKGAAWWAITPELAQRVLDEWDNNKSLKRYFSTSFCPAETFAQTVVFNSELASRCMLYEGEYPGLAALTPLTFIDYGKEIKVLDTTDYQRIMDSGKMFCRKTTTGMSDELMELIDKARQ